jgi:hypothetical protein
LDAAHVVSSGTSTYDDAGAVPRAKLPLKKQYVHLASPVAKKRKLLSGEAEAEGGGEVGGPWVTADAMQQLTSPPCSRYQYQATAGATPGGRRSMGRSVGGDIKEEGVEGEEGTGELLLLPEDLEVADVLLHIKSPRDCNSIRSSSSNSVCIEGAQCGPSPQPFMSRCSSVSSHSSSSSMSPFTTSTSSSTDNSD